MPGPGLKTHTYQATGEAKRKAESHLLKFSKTILQTGYFYLYKILQLKVYRANNPHKCINQMTKVPNSPANEKRNPTPFSI